MLPDPANQATLTAEEVANAVGIGVTLTRQLGRRYIATDGADGIPAVAYGRLLKFPTAAVRQHLGIDPPQVSLTPPMVPRPSRQDRPPAIRETGKAIGSVPPVRIVPKVRT
jgi:hypothetical protein